MQLKKHISAASQSPAAWNKSFYFYSDSMAKKISKGWETINYILCFCHCSEGGHTGPPQLKLHIDLGLSIA